jgi:hypothetical protein
MTTRHHWTSVSGLRFTAIDVQAHLRERRIRYNFAQIRSSISSILNRLVTPNSATSVLLMIGLALPVTLIT